MENYPNNSSNLTISPKVNNQARIKKKRKGSIFKKIFLMVTGSLFLLLTITLTLNTFMLEPYYTKQKSQMLIEKFESINDLLAENSADSATKLQDEIYEIYSVYSIQVAVQNRFGQWVSLSAEDGFIRDLPETLTVPSNERYSIKTTTDRRTNSELLALVGMFDDSSVVALTMPIEPIQESVVITNSFVLLSGSAAFFISVIILIFMTRSLTKPIVELTKNAEMMSNLDFSVRNKIRSNDEISHLGESMNSLAHSLEISISHLKSANLRLIDENRQKTMQNEAHKAFISNVSHELKTPLAIMQAYAENLRENIDSGLDPSFYCGVIEDEVLKMNMMIKKMTMLMQLESGKETLEIKLFNVVELANNILEVQQEIYDVPSVEITPIDSSYESYVWGDEFLIENVITNYLSNAFNHVCENGKITISTSLLFDQLPDGSRAKERVRLSVFNSGNAISQDDVVKIWDNFYKVDKARTREYGGTGIGLSVVSAIMKAHNMPFGVVNHPDGVEFFFELES